MSYDDLTTYVNASLQAGITNNTSVHDEHVWMFYLYNLNQSS